MSSTIKHGPGNEAVYSEKVSFKASSAVSRGQVVCLTTGLGTASFAVTPADSDGTNLDITVGVAHEAIASGAWGQVVTGGYCAYVLTDGTVAVGDPLVPHTVAGEASVMVAGEEHIVFGHALSADTGTVEYCDALIIKRY